MSPVAFSSSALLCSSLPNFIPPAQHEMWVRTMRAVKDEVPSRKMHGLLHQLLGASLLVLQRTGCFCRPYPVLQTVSCRDIRQAFSGSF